MSGSVLLIVDVQNDFCQKIPGADEIIAPLNSLISYAKNHHWLLVASRDWHSPQLFKNIPQKAHCLQNSDGAKFHPALNLNNTATIISKGASDLSDRHYSAFNGDSVNLKKLLNSHNINSVYIAGLATDYCVKNTAIDSVKNNFTTYLIEDACRAVNKTPDGETKAISEMKSFGVRFVNSAAFTPT